MQNIRSISKTQAQRTERNLRQRCLADSVLRLSACAAILATLVGCASIAETPTFSRPDMSPIKQDWSSHLGEERAIAIKWWQSFDEPELDALMERAIAANFDLQRLRAHVDVAGAGISTAKARLLPVINSGLRADSRTISGETDLGTSIKTGTGTELAWELDIWGKARKGVAASEAAYAASEAEWRAGYLVMASSVADAYFQVRQIDQQLVRQDEAIEAAEHVLNVQEQMHERGMIPQTHVAQQEAELFSLNAQRLELERIRELAVNALGTLTGVGAGELSLPASRTDSTISLVPVPAGMPSEIISRRPDLVAAEYRLLQAVELEGQARLARLPTIGLTGIGGSASYDLSDMLKTWTSGLSGVVQFPVFDPNVRARIRVSQAQVATAEAEYRAVVMRAFEEVENLLVNISNRTKQHEQLVARANQLQSIQKRFEDQLRLGLISQLELLEQQRSLLAAEQAVLTNHWQLMTDNVNLFKAVGGGWQADIVGGDQ